MSMQNERTTRNYYDQGNYQNRYRPSSGDRKTSFRVEVSIDRIIEEGCSMLIPIGITYKKQF